MDGALAHPDSYREVEQQTQNLLTEGVEKKVGALAQSVEQQTENLCVPGSIPGGTTQKSESGERKRFESRFFFEFRSETGIVWINPKCWGGSSKKM